MVNLTERELYAVAFVVRNALIDEEPSDVRAALIRALAKLEAVARRERITT